MLDIKASKETELRDFQAREKLRASELVKRLRQQKETEITKVRYSTHKNKA